MSSAKDDKELLNMPLQAAPLTLHEAGVLYDQKVGGGVRHLHVRRAYGVYEAAWEGAPLGDQHRLHAIDRDRAAAEGKLLKALLRRLGR